MYARRSHKKSRFGCRKCKSRKMKCDEIHPTCGNCSKHKIHCDFTPLNDDGAARVLKPVKIDPLQKWLKSENSSRGVSPLPSSNSSTISLLLDTATDPTSYASSHLSTSGETPGCSQTEIQYCPSPILVGTPADRLLELKLFHHYVEMTSSASMSPLAEIPRNSTGQHIWAAWMTGLAFTNQSLMDALLGFSAFHLRHLHPLDHSMSKASHWYMMRALSGHAQDLRSGLDEKNAEAVFATSTFVAVHAGMSRKFLTGSQTKAPPLHWFRSYQGIKAVLEAGWEWIQKSSVQPLLQVGLENLKNPTSPWKQRQELGMKELPFDFLLDGLFLEEHDAASIEAYETTVAHLNTICFSPIQRHILRFPAMVPQLFVEMVGAQDPRALAIVGYFFMLLKKMEQVQHVWWLQGTIECEFTTLMEILPKNWWPKMEWAVRVFEGYSDGDGDIEDLTDKKNEILFMDSQSWGKIFPPPATDGPVEEQTLESRYLTRNTHDK